MSKSLRKNIALYLMALFYLLAGINHFIRPEGYLQIIPSWLGNPDTVNILSGIAEVVLSLLLLIKKTRKLACYMIILLLLAFIPAHIQMIKTGFCVRDICLPTWALWMRLVLFQPLLIWWAYWLSNK